MVNDKSHVKKDARRVFKIRIWTCSWVRPGFPPDLQAELWKTAWRWECLQWEERKGFRPVTFLQWDESVSHQVHPPLSDTVGANRCINNGHWTPTRWPRIPLEELWTRTPLSTSVIPYEWKWNSKQGVERNPPPPLLAIVGLYLTNRHEKLPLFSSPPLHNE